MRPDNPFSSRFVDPAGHPFLFPPGQTLAMVGERWQTQGWWGEIVGPHGSGKSTLLHTLISWAGERGCSGHFIFLNDQQHRLPADWAAAGSTVDFYAVDGAEQLSGWAWWRLRRHCRRRACGLLVTAHRRLGLPPLYQTTAANGPTVQRVLAALAPQADYSDQQCAQLAEQHGGNLRSILFALYDRWESELGV